MGRCAGERWRGEEVKREGWKEEEVKREGRRGRRRAVVNVVLDNQTWRHGSDRYTV